MPTGPGRPGSSRVNGRGQTPTERGQTPTGRFWHSTKITGYSPSAVGQPLSLMDFEQWSFV